MNGRWRGTDRKRKRGKERRQGKKRMQRMKACDENATGKEKREKGCAGKGWRRK